MALHRSTNPIYPLTSGWSRSDLKRLRAVDMFYAPLYGRSDKGCHYKKLRSVSGVAHLFLPFFDLQSNSNVDYDHMQPGS